jgi:cell division protein ZapA
MSNLTLTIAGRDYQVACAEGEEAHILGLGRLIEAKVQSVGGSTGQTEVRSLLFAALLLADEVHEARQGGGTPAPAAPPGEDPLLAAKFEALASRLENCASALES